MFGKRAALVGLRCLTVAGVLAAGVLVAPAASGSSLAASSDSKAPVYYLSLGDSLAAGEQPTLPPGQNFGDEGYADQLYAVEHATIQNLQLVKLGCGGQSTASMITAVPTVEVPASGRFPTRAAATTTTAATRTARNSRRRSTSSAP